MNAEERARAVVATLWVDGDVAHQDGSDEQRIIARAIREAVLEEREACAVAICLPCQRGVPFASPNWHRDDHGYEYACNGGTLRGRPQP